VDESGSIVVLLGMSMFHCPDAISRKYGECPNLIYETFNEPHAKPKQKLSWTSEVKPFHEAILQLIRKNASDNLVLLGTPCYSLNIDEVLESPATKFKNIVYVPHFYAATHKNETASILKPKSSSLGGKPTHPIGKTYPSAITRRIPNPQVRTNHSTLHHRTHPNYHPFYTTITQRLKSL